MLDEQFLNKEFVIASLTRTNLQAQGFTTEQIAKLCDEDMREIASAMEDIYFDHGYWEDLELCTRRTLECKSEDAVLEQTRGGEDGLT